MKSLLFAALAAGVAIPAGARAQHSDPAGNAGTGRMLVAAVPKGFAMTSEHARFVNEFIDSLFPVRPEGLNFDLYVSNTDVDDTTWRLSPCLP